MSTLSDSLFSTRSSPILHESRSYGRRKPHRVSLGVAPLDDIISFTTPLSPPPPHSAFDVLMSNHALASRNLVCASMPWDTPLCQSIPQDITRGIAGVFCGALGAQRMSDTAVCQVSNSDSSMDGSGSLSRRRGKRETTTTTTTVEGGRLSLCQPPTATWSPTPETPRNIPLQCYAGPVSGVPPLPLVTAVPSPSFLRSARSPPMASRRSPCTRRLETEAAHVMLSGCRMSQEDALCIHEQVQFPSGCAISGAAPPTYSMYGVFDGHNGSCMSNLASLYYLEHFNDALLRVLPALHVSAREVESTSNGAEIPHLDPTPPQRFFSSALVQALIHLDRTLYDTTQDVQRLRCSGTTASIVAFYHGVSTSPEKRATCYLSVANLGDSRSVLARISDGCVIFSTVDHRVVAYPSERARVERCGGCIECDRVDGALEVTRSLGDFVYKLSPERWMSQNDEIGNNPCCRSCTSTPSGAEPFTLEVSGGASMHRLCCCYSCSDAARESRPFRMVSHDGTDVYDGSSCATPRQRSSDEREFIEGTETQLTSNVVSNVADVYEAELAGDEFLLLATDGLWDRMNTVEVVEFVRMRLLQGGYFLEVEDSSPLSPSSPSSSVVDHWGAHSNDRVSEKVPLECDHTSSFCPATSYVASGVRVAAGGVLPQDGSAASDGDDTRMGSTTPRHDVLDGQRRERRGCSGTPHRGVLHDVASSLANHVVHELHGTDNVTIVLLAFRAVD